MRGTPHPGPGPRRRRDDHHAERRRGYGERLEKRRDEDERRSLGQERNTIQPGSSLGYRHPAPEV